ncbi:MAG: FAD-dependent oxidoreductase [Pseudorhodoplanes sp.]|nr:FAD-dependent oxidoreductase [Pseudorhodoplanes sp.]
MPEPTIHIAGAGLSGLAAAVRLVKAGRRVRVYEAARQAGGRCRSYFDQTLGMEIDNGNHLLLSGNRAAMDFLRAIGSEDKLRGPQSAEFPFVDLATGARWVLRPNEGRIGWWILDAKRRVPGTRALDYLSILGLLRAGPDATIGDVMTCEGMLYRRLWEPLFVAALNTDVPVSTARLAAAVVRETLLAGGRSCRPLVAHQGLAKAFVDPALQFLGTHGMAVEFGRRLRALTFEGGRATRLDLGDAMTDLSPDDRIVLAVPPPVAADLLPGLTVPDNFRAIVNAHFKVAPPPGTPLITGVVGGLVEWIFAFPDRISITVSNGDRLLETPREALAPQIWADVVKALGVAADLPPWQIVREKRATFAALPAQERRRPGAETRWSNLVLAGDWTDTGLPATIEGSIRSGYKAAELVLRLKQGS